MAGLLECLVLRRGLMTCRYTTESGPIWLCNAHMNCGWLAQAHEMHAYCARLQVEQNPPCLVFIDANADGEQPKMRWLRGEGGWNDAYKLMHTVSAAESGATWCEKNPHTAGLLKRT